MRLSRTLLISMVLLTLMSQPILSGKKKKSGKKKDLTKECETCRGIAAAFHEGIKRTTKSNFGGGNTAWEERALGSYANSETRFVEISETLCDKSKHEGNGKINVPVDKEGQVIESRFGQPEYGQIIMGDYVCHKMVEEHEEALETWWMDHREDNEDLHQWFCIDELKVCCPNNTYGSDCKECPGGITRPCMGNGKCSGEGTRSGSGKCKCSDGYKGALCDTCKDGFYESVKNDTHVICLACHKACADTCWGGSAKDCDECKEGWKESEDEGCEDVDECTDDNPPCESNQYCVNTEGSYSCKDCDYSCDSCLGDGADKCVKCRSGYHMIEGECEDINECKEDNIECDEPMTCYNDPGSYHCGCKEGYERYQGECIDKEILKELKKMPPKKEDSGKENDDGADDDDVVEGVVGSDGGSDGGGEVASDEGRESHIVESDANVRDDSDNKNLNSEEIQNLNSDAQIDDSEHEKIQQHSHTDDIHKEL